MSDEKVHSRTRLQIYSITVVELVTVNIAVATVDVDADVGFDIALLWMLVRICIATVDVGDAFHWSTYEFRKQ